MKKILLSIILLCQYVLVFAEDFGGISITPYIHPSSEYSKATYDLLQSKMVQISTLNNVSGGFEKRFVLTPKINVLSEATTATIPQKTSVRVSVVFMIGDGVSGTLFNSAQIECIGIGLSKDDAIKSAIKKINIHNPCFDSLIDISKKRIVDYYDNVSPSLINEARVAIASLEYEQAAAKVSVIPSSCKYYDAAQQIMIECGTRIIARDNNDYYNKAQAAWNSSSNESGAHEAANYLSKIIITDSKINGKVNAMYTQMRNHLVDIENKMFEYNVAKLESDERIKTEKIKTAGQAASSFFQAFPKLIYNIISWF